jgi:hypothetical protein
MIAIFSAIISAGPDVFHMSACFATIFSSTFSPVPPIMMGG